MKSKILGAMKATKTEKLLKSLKKDYYDKMTIYFMYVIYSKPPDTIFMGIRNCNMNLLSSSATKFIKKYGTGKSEIVE